MNRIFPFAISALLLFASMLATAAAQAEMLDFKLSEPLYAKMSGNWNTVRYQVIDGAAAESNGRARGVGTTVSLWLEVGVRRPNIGVLFTTYPLTEEWISARNIRGLKTDTAAKSTQRYVIQKAGEEQPIRAETVSVWACKEDENDPSESVCTEALVTHNNGFMMYRQSMPGLSGMEGHIGVTYMTATEYARVQEEMATARSERQKQDAQLSQENAARFDAMSKRLDLERNKRAAALTKLPAGPYLCRPTSGSPANKDAELALNGNKHSFLSCSGMPLSVVDPEVLARAGLRLVNVTETDIVASEGITGDVILEGKKLYHYYK